MKRLIPLAALSSIAACAPSHLSGAEEEAALLAERRIWWANPHHALEVETMRPLETVKGAASEPLPAGDPALAKPLREAGLGALGDAGAAALLVWHDGALQLEYYGEGYGPDMLSAPASMPKPVLALAIGAAVDQGLLSLDEPVSLHITEWRNDPRGKITLRQLLQMRSGLQKYGATSTGGAAEQLMLGTRLEDLLLETPLTGTPGARFDYNNIDNATAMLVLQRAIGTHYAAFLSRNIWQKIGARDAHVWLDRPGGMPRTFCCLLATPRDWVRVGLLIRDMGAWQGQQIVSRGYMEQMIAPSPTNPSYAFQLWRGTDARSRSYGSGTAPALQVGEPYAVDDLLILDGAIGQRVYISAKLGLVIVRIGEMAPDWRDSALPNAIIAALGADAAD
ncbi:serine hydrolase [Croceicoccus sp. Ery5]|uniref:serine hydrolase domain-containing protein n=1 Tax=Croceicoccus sp. Ery5 TaxID=1703340 RepID=UPI001E28C83F|nr:serine hydrolase [Croceicoccus sp. Ery5]